ncbi:hypothetical protein SCARR_04905 [Pontiella sulfatireligans]|uniref:Uncharacterized protein n=2 Tax=Pontiella sulfatireligans TaxID=2750658 RepID=A0A6C2URD1_9BACT|nr:hypothetical protein SCARR_04905 [Pontiella sulfatireligans]
MALAFDLYNSIGNLWDENDYKAKLLERCLASGLHALPEVQVKVEFKDFCKPYFIDLLIEGAVYELKTVEGITSPNESQTLNYLFLTNTQHGKIINFRPDSLERRFVSTSLTLDQRQSFFLKTDDWIEAQPANLHLPDLLAELLNEWGAYLNIQLYKEAVLFFMEHPSEDANTRFCATSPDTLLHFTGLSRKKASYEKNLQKYLNASEFEQIDWINFDQNEIELSSLRKKLFCH